MLMELLGRRSPAPAQDVARRILGEDVTQIEYYTERVKRMVGKGLTGNGITRYERGTYGLVGGEELSNAEREELLQLCRQRHDAFRIQCARRWLVCSRRSLRLRAQEPPPHADQRLDQLPGAHPCPRPLRMLRRTRAPEGPGGGPHRAQEPRRLGRPQQPAGPLLPLQCRQTRCSLPTQEGTTDFR
jgi:hypothetical protein